MTFYLIRQAMTNENSASERLTIQEAMAQLQSLETSLEEAKNNLLDDIHSFVAGNRTRFRAFVDDFSEIGEGLGFAPLRATIIRKRRPKTASTQVDIKIDQNDGQPDDPGEEPDLSND